MLNLDELPAIYASFRARYKERDTRMLVMNSVVKGTALTSTTPDDDDHENTSPNLIQVALEDTAESAAIMPSFRVLPPKVDAESKKKAEKMEKIVLGYIDRAGGYLFLIRSFMDLAAFGFFTPSAFMDNDVGNPALDLRPAVGCYPDPDWRPGQSIRRCIYARSIFFTQLPPEYQAKCRVWANETDSQIVRNNRHVVLLEYFDEDEQVVALLTTSAFGTVMNARMDSLPCVLERFQHGYKLCPVTVGQRITLDGEPRGQFDQVVAPMYAHSRLMAMAIDYADQSVYCTAPHTRVLTDDLEWVPVGELAEGDKIVGFDEEAGTPGDYRKWRAATVLKTGRATLPSYRVTLEDGTEIVASAQHKWLTANVAHRNNWVTTEELFNVQGRWNAPKLMKVMDVWDERHTYDAGYLAGMYDGEASLCRPKAAGLQMGMGQRDNEALAEVEAAMVREGFLAKRQTALGGTNKDVTCLNLLGGRTEVMKFLGSIRPKRLLAKWRTLGGAECLGRVCVKDRLAVTSVEFLGDQEVVTLATSTKTLVAEGLASHNSDIWVKEPMGDMPFGGGGVIQLGANGAIGRVPPAVSSLSLFNELDQLMDTIHLGGRWPKSRPGEISQSIASAKFLETSVGVMNTAIRTYHLIMAQTMERVLRIMLKMDFMHGRADSVARGVLRNQEFIEAYDPQQDIDLEYRVKVEYGLGLGHDPAQSAVLHIQYQGAGMISKEFVQDSIEGITDVARERRRIDVEKFTDMMFGKLMQGVQGGTIPDQALVEMALARQQGEGIFDIFKKYIVDPQTAAQATGITSGITGALQQPGPGGATPGPGAGMTPPPPPDMPKAMSRLSMPAGPGRGNFLGSSQGG